MIILEKKILLNNHLLENKTEYDDIQVNFLCSECKHLNEINFNLNTSKFIEDLINEKFNISIDEIIAMKIAEKSSKYNAHFGKFTIHNLPAYFHLCKCNSCHESYIISFGLGEISNGRNICYILGVWNVII